MNSSFSPLCEETQNLLRKARSQPFNCRFIGLLYIHNYLMFLRDKSIKDPQQLSLIDIRGQTQSEHYDQERVFKSTWFDLGLFVKKQQEGNDNPASRDWCNLMTKTHISMKYMFIIGFPSDFDSPNFRDFLSVIMNLQSGKPFQLFLYRFNSEILQLEYPYLFLEGDRKKALALYPNIILKCVDLGVSDQKNNFQLCVGSNFNIKLDQIEALGIHSIVVVDDLSSEPEIQQKFNLYKKQNLKALSLTLIDRDYQKLFSQTDNFEASFKKLGDQISDLIQKSLDKDEKILILSTDMDNITAALIIYALMKNYKFNYTAALQLVRERRITVKLDKK